MTSRFLEVSYRSGQPFAAYFHLPRRDGDRAERSVKAGDGLVVDLAADGRAIGIEITSPARFEVEKLNRALAQFGSAPDTRADVAPICAA